MYNAQGAYTCKCLLAWETFHDNTSLRWPKWGSFDMSELCTQLEKACYETRWSETRKLFGSLSEAPTFGEEPTLREMLWSSFGWFVAAAFGIFAQNRPCFHWKWKTTDGWDLYSVMLPRSWICFNKRGRFEHWVFHVLSIHVLSTNKTETKAKICLHLVCVCVSVCVIHVRYFLYLRVLLLTSIL